MLRPSAVFLKAEEKEFSCIGVSPVSIAESMNQKVVTTLSPTDFETFIQATYGVSAIPHFDHTAEAEIRLIRHTLFVNRTNLPFFSGFRCCDEDRAVISGRIKSIEGSDYEITTDAGQEITVKQTLCSRVYKLRKELGDQIILKTAEFEEVEYMLDALIYQSKAR